MMTSAASLVCLFFAHLRKCVEFYENASFALSMPDYALSAQNEASPVGW